MALDAAGAGGQAAPAPSGGGGPPSVGRKASFVLASQALGSALGFSILLVVGRYYDPVAYGYHIFSLHLLGFLPLLADGGFGAAHIYFVARGTDIPRALGVYARIRVGLTVGLVLLVALASVVWIAVLRKPISDATTLPVLGAVLVLQCVSSFRQVAFDTWIGKERVNRTETVRTLDTVLVLALLAALGLALGARAGRWTPFGVGDALAAALGLGPSWDLPRVGLALALAYLAGKAVSLLPVAWWWVRDRTQVGAWDPNLARQYARYAIPVVLAGAPAVLLMYADIVMLGFLKAAGEVGEYAAAQKLSAIGLLAATALGTPLLPRFSALLRAGRMADARAILDRAERFVLLAGVPASVAVLVLAEPLIHVAVGDPYLGGAGAMRFMALTALVATAMTAGTAKIMADGRSRVVMAATLAAFALNALLNLWLIPVLGTTGPAVSTFLSSLVGAAYVRLALRRRFAVPLWGPAFTGTALAGLGAGLFWWLALRWAGPAAFDRVWELGLWVLAGAALFAGLAGLLGLLRRDDLRALWRIASPAGLWRELRGRA